MKQLQFFFYAITDDKYRNEIMQKIRIFSAVQKVRALPKDWLTLRLLFSGNLIDHWKVLVPGFSQGLPQQNKLKFSNLRVVRKRYL